MLSCLFATFLFCKYLFYEFQMSLTLVYLKCLLLTWIIVNYNTSVENTLVIIINSSFTLILISGKAWKEVFFSVFLPKFKKYIPFSFRFYSSKHCNFLLFTQIHNTKLLHFPLVYKTEKNMILRPTTRLT